MKRRKLLFSLFALVVLTVVGTLTILPNTDSKTEKVTIKKKKNQKAIAGAMDFYHRQKANFQTGEIEADKIIAARIDVQKMSSSKALGLTWAELGPNNVGGRIRALLIDNTNASIMYAGGVNGGLWKSTTAGQSWVQVPLSGNNAVSSICQNPDGDIYVGTGEGLAAPGSTNHNTGAFGNGIYYKAASQTVFTHLSSTNGWNKINRLASDKNGKVYAATSIGLRSTSDNGQTWSQSKVGSFNDVKIANNNTFVIASSGNKVYFSNDGSTWTTSTLPTAGVGRVELAISPSDISIIYAVMATSGGAFYGIYRSTNAGANWYQIAVGGSSSFNLFGDNNQGWYDNVAMVHGSNPDIVYVGGIDMWKGEKITSTGPFSWTRKTMWNASEFSSVYVHADQHVYTQHPNDPNTFYLGTDGGIFKTTNAGNSFATLNKNFNVTQFYAVSSHPSGGAIGGTQDNGTQFVDFQGNNPQQARQIRGGDGGWSAASMLNQEVIFASLYYGDVGRSKDFGQTFQDPTDPATGDPEFYSDVMISGLAGAFVTPTILWETIHYQNSIDSIYYVADTNYVLGDTIDGRSKTNNNYPFVYELQQNLDKGDTIKLMDPVQSRLFIGTAAGIYMTKQSLYFVNKTPIWFKVSVNSIPNTAVWNMQISRDGDVLYYAVNQYLFRLSNLLNAQDSATADVGGANYIIQDTLIKPFSGIISSISIDPSDANRVIVTLSGTGNNQVYYSSNATSSNPVFAAKKGDLTANLPVYASLIPLNNSQHCIIGTEYGIFTTDNIMSPAPVWTKANNGIDEMTAVYMLHQQQNSLAWRQTVTFDNGNPLVQVFPGVYNKGFIYAATHGRGLFSSNTYVSIEQRPTEKQTQLSNVKLYPNPVIDIAIFEYTVTNNSKVIVNIYDITGKMVVVYNLGTKSGAQKSEINMSDLSAGTYIMQLQTEGQSLTKKFIKR